MGGPARVKSCEGEGASDAKEKGEEGGARGGERRMRVGRGKEVRARQEGQQGQRMCLAHGCRCANRYGALPTCTNHPCCMGSQQSLLACELHDLCCMGPTNCCHVVFLGD